jgi:hypothetical protein
MTCNIHILTLKCFSFEVNEGLYCDILGYDTVYPGRRVLVCRRNTEGGPPSYSRNFIPEHTVLHDTKPLSNSLDLL